MKKLGFHWHAGIVSRTGGRKGNRATSAVEKAAYNARTKLHRDETDDATRDYGKNHSELLFQGVFAPANAPAWARDREALWNEVEHCETRVDAQLARDLEFTYPSQLNQQQREWMLFDYVRENFVRKGMVCDAVIHAPEDAGAEDSNQNYHTHILLTLRQIGPEGFDAKKAREWNDRALMNEWKEDWARRCGDMLERIGIDKEEAERWRHGHLTLKQQCANAIERGDLDWADELDREPTIHRGPNVDQMEAKGIDTEIGTQARAIEARNDYRMYLRTERDLAAWEQALNLSPLDAATVPVPEIFDHTAKDYSLSAVANIHRAYELADTAQEFLGELSNRGFTLARATQADADASVAAHEAAVEKGRYTPEYAAGQYVAINADGRVFGLNRHTCGDAPFEVEQFLTQLAAEPLAGIGEYQATVQQGRSIDVFSRVSGAATRAIADFAQVVEQEHPLPEVEIDPIGPERVLNKIQSQIRLAYSLTNDSAEWLEAMSERGLTVAKFTADNVEERDRMAVAAAMQAGDWRAEEKPLNEEQERKARESHASYIYNKTERQGMSVDDLERPPMEFEEYVGFVQDRFQQAIKDDPELTALRADPMRLEALDVSAGYWPHRAEAGDLVVVDKRGNVGGFYADNLQISEKEMARYLGAVEEQYTNVMTLPEVREMQIRQQEFEQRSWRRQWLEDHPTKVGTAPHEIRDAYLAAETPEAFQDDLQRRDIRLARVNASDCAIAFQDTIESLDPQSQIQRVGRCDEGDYVAVSAQGRVYRLTMMTTGDTADEVKEFLAPLAATPMKGALETVDEINSLKDPRPEWVILPTKDFSYSTHETAVGETLIGAGNAVAKVAVLASKVLESVTDAAEGLLEAALGGIGGVSPLTPDEVKGRAFAREQAAEERRIAAIDTDRWLKDKEYREHVDRQREAEKLAGQKEAEHSRNSGRDY